MVTHHRYNDYHCNKVEMLQVIVSVSPKKTYFKPFQTPNAEKSTCASTQSDQQLFCMFYASKFSSSSDSKAEQACLSLTLSGWETLKEKAQII